MIQASAGPGAPSTAAHHQVVVGAEEGVETEPFRGLRHRQQVVVAGPLLGFGEDPELHAGHRSDGGGRAGRRAATGPGTVAPMDRARSAAMCWSTASDGATSPSNQVNTTWFLDTKQTACRPEGSSSWRTRGRVMPAEVDAIGGLTMGADPVAFGIAAVAATRDRPLRSFSVRKEAKDHGVPGRIAGALLPGDKVAITEDTVTRGTSIMEAVDATRLPAWSRRLSSSSSTGVGPVA